MSLVFATSPHRRHVRDFSFFPDQLTRCNKNRIWPLSKTALSSHGLKVYYYESALSGGDSSADIDGGECFISTTSQYRPVRLNSE
jgi:hypothetical protein